ncbi:Hpt domain-containing protein [Maricaulis salignorans]|uniref:Hpt domain-containing protein n=2 Tax=Maricaulis salignorans TaxID=144026 RepID=A0A1G9VDS6_9PROT|nr:Hpt domain-containing protein [Maricaulis salignorans]
MEAAEHTRDCSQSKGLISACAARAGGGSGSGAPVGRSRMAVASPHLPWARKVCASPVVLSVLLRQACELVAMKPARPDSSVNVTAPLFDAAHLARYTGGDAELKAELLALMCEQAERCIGLISSAPDHESWTSALHTLKGAARGVGAFALGEACEAAEEAPQARWPEAARSVAQAFGETRRCFERS